MLDFRISGFDILPDILGFIFFAIGIKALLAESEHFQQAGKFNLAMIFLSFFSLYEPPSGPESAFNIFGFLVAIVTIIVTWHLVYHLFMGISELASSAGRSDLQAEAVRRWEQYRHLMIATIVTFFLIIIPPLAVIVMFGLIIASIVLCIGILGFLKKCEAFL